MGFPFSGVTLNLVHIERKLEWLERETENLNEKLEIVKTSAVEDEGEALRGEGRVSLVFLMPATLERISLILKSAKNIVPRNTSTCL